MTCNVFVTSTINIFDIIKLIPIHATHVKQEIRNDTMKIRIIPKFLLYICVAIYFFCMFSFYIPISVDAQTNEEIQDDEIVRTISTINELRKIYDLPLLYYNDILNKTANTHNLYMKYNSSFSSIEESGKLYFRGRYPWDRALYNGYSNKYVYELLSKDVLNYYDGLSKLMQNPYARYSILDPLYTHLGMNKSENLTTYLLGGSSRNKNFEIFYPYNRQQNIPLVFENTFSVNPFAQLSFETVKTGIPFSYSLYTSESKITDIKNIVASIVNMQTNEAVKIKIVTSLEDRNLTNSIMVMPLESYNLGTTYKVSLSADLTFDRPILLDQGTSSSKKTINYTGTFTTIKDASSEIQNSYVTREQFVVDLMKSSTIPIQESLEIIFPDVKSNSPNYKYIYTSYINKLVIGYNDGLYRPNANITREQAYTILIRHYEKQHGIIEITESDQELEFSDAKEISSYALEPIYKAKKIGLLTDNQYEFLPHTYISVNEFQQIMERYDK